jgi:hypothetical protein
LASNFSPLNLLRLKVNNNDSQVFSSQCEGLYCNYLPIILLSALFRIDIPPCRWPHAANHLLYISYKWGSELQLSGTPWRNSFESGIISWNNTITPVWYYHDGDSDNRINTAYLPNVPFQGVTTSVCDGNQTLYWEIIGNILFLFMSIHNSATSWDFNP